MRITTLREQSFGKETRYGEGASRWGVNFVGGGRGVGFATKKGEKNDGSKTGEAPWGGGKKSLNTRTPQKKSSKKNTKKRGGGTKP